MPSNPIATIEAAERRELRRRGHELKPRLQVGKAGLTEAILAAGAQALARDPLLKVRLPRGQMAAELAEQLGAIVLATVGRNALLYRSPTEASDVPS